MCYRMDINNIRKFIDFFSATGKSKDTSLQTSVCDVDSLARFPIYLSLDQVSRVDTNS